MNTQRQSVELGTGWMWLLKVVLVVVPSLTACAVPWFIWVTKTSYRAEQTALVVDKVVEEMKAVNTKLSSMPIESLLERVKATELDARQNLIDHSDIKVSLEQIKAKLGVIPPGT